MKQIITVFIAILFSSVSIAQKWEKTPSGIKSMINDVNTEIRFFSASTVRVIKSPAGSTADKKSLSVISTERPVPFTAKEQNNVVTVKIDSLLVKLDLQSGALGFYSKPDRPLLMEKREGLSFTPFDDAGNKSYTIEQRFILDKDEAIYGLGQQQRGKMIQRNLRLNMVQGNTDDYITFFQSAKGYGLFWDNYSPTVFTDNPESTSFRSEVGDCIDYYFMYGGNADGVIARMRELTGRAPMFPLWTYGFFQSKERYKSQDELISVIKKYREARVPLDGIIQDWQYWGNNYLWNAMDFLNPDFYDPKKMIDEVHRLNAHMTISIWNSFGPQTKQYKELDKIGALMNFKTWPESGSEKWPPNNDYPSGVRVYDPYNPRARDIFWKYLNEGLFKPGIDGWWMDSSEPDHLQAKPSDFNNRTFLGSFRKVRNAFPLMTVGGVYDHQRSVSDSKRVFILTRSAFAGQQRYGANTWSGDVVASWSTLRNQISAGLNFSLCGIPYWNSDIGGFFLWEFRKKLEDPEYRELYVRWLEFGTFCPMMRSHGADAPREIYQFGKKGDKAYDAIEKFIRLRYRLLPYIYSTSWDVTANHSSMMRALVMDFPNDKAALDINDQFMFGRSILVSPVTKPMYIKPSVNGKDTSFIEDFSALKSKDTYLPAGTTWYDFWTGEQLNGGKPVPKETPIDLIPLYVKAGSIIPLGPDVQFASEKPWDELDIYVYPGKNGSFVLYEDENDNYNYEKGLYSTITFSWDDSKKALTIGDRKGSFPGMLTTRKFNIILADRDKGYNGPETRTPARTVTYAGMKTTVKM